MFRISICHHWVKQRINSPTQTCVVTPWYVNAAKSQGHASYMPACWMNNIMLCNAKQSLYDNVDSIISQGHISIYVHQNKIFHDTCIHTINDCIYSCAFYDEKNTATSLVVMKLSDTSNSLIYDIVNSSCDETIIGLGQRHCCWYPGVGISSATMVSNI